MFLRSFSIDHSSKESSYKRMMIGWLHRASTSCRVLADSCASRASQCNGSRHDETTGPTHSLRRSLHLYACARFLCLIRTALRANGIGGLTLPRRLPACYNSFYVCTLPSRLNYQLAFCSLPTSQRTLSNDGERWHGPLRPGFIGAPCFRPRHR